MMLTGVSCDSQKKCIFERSLNNVVRNSSSFVAVVIRKKNVSLNAL